MALVILPCDLPHWCNLQVELTRLSTATDAKRLVDGMLKIHNMCNTSTGLDPDEPDKTDPTIFQKLENYLMDLSSERKNHFFGKTLGIITRKALDLKTLKPKNGFHFSLQQQADKMEYKRSFLASLLSHSFFSTFPKRTAKTHPTLQDFNFTHFFKHLDEPIQQAKLESIFHYFDLIGESDSDLEDCVSFSRQVMSGKQWLTIEDWLDSCLPLCPITVRNEGRIEEVESQCLRVCFSTSRIGGAVLCEGSSQECIDFCTIPELICILASVEALEDNEVLIVKDAYQVARIISPREKTYLETFEKPNKVSICCMDPENYTRLPLSQLEEDNLLRELNKALLGFRQGVIVPAQRPPNVVGKSATAVQRRLSPIGESFSSTPPEQSPSNVSMNTEEQSHRPCGNIDSPTRRQNWLKPHDSTKTENLARRGKFIVLGSSGECLPVNRTQTFFAGKREVFLSEEVVTPERRDSMYSSAQSEDDCNDDSDENEDGDEDVFHSARTSVDKEDYSKVIHSSPDPYSTSTPHIHTSTWTAHSGRDSSKSDEGYPKPNTIDVNSISTDEEKRYSFAERLREALLRGATTYSNSSDDSSYAVGISVTGSSAERNYIRCRRGTSTGFLLQEESLDDGFYQGSAEQDANSRGNESDRYSFTTDGSELEEMYDQLAQWINTANGNPGEIKREKVISDFASCLMKRAFSDSYADREEGPNKKLVSAARSLSLELAKQNPKLAAELISMLSDKDMLLKTMLPNKYGQRPVATGNWGCGSCHGGDAQIKLTIQWLAASYTGLPNLIYYTCRHHKLVKLDTVRRVLVDRGWTVGQLTTSLLQYAQMSLHNAQSSPSLFDLLINAVHT